MCSDIQNLCFLVQTLILLTDMNARPMSFTGSNSWHTYACLFITANVTYKSMLPIHCMQSSLWPNDCMELLYDTMNKNAYVMYIDIEVSRLAIGFLKVCIIRLPQCYNSTLNFAPCIAHLPAAYY